MDPSQGKPSRIGAYDIVDVIGRGGMGTVFRGNDPRIGRAVAIKMLTAAADDPDLLIRFYREAKYTGSLHHQNIVTVYELGHQDGVPYLVMEFLEGRTLEAVIGSGQAMPIAEKLGIILQVCSGLSYAHKNALVHRDIKPANIMILPDGTAKIVDFGIALLGGSRLTKTGHVVGSLNYMSPEQLSGNVEVDARTDVYSTGVVLFQMLTGVLPFDGGSTAATLRRIVQDPPPRLSEYLADCPEELEAILHRALVKNREERYGSPEEFAADLMRVHQHYMNKAVGETLLRASEALHRRDFTSARQQVLAVLKTTPQNAEATELLRQIKLGQDQVQQEQQVLHLQMKAEEAFRKNHLEEALQYVEHGMRLDPNGTVFPGLRDAIRKAQASAAEYREAVKRAEAALRGGDLEGAKRLVEKAQAILPDDAAARTLAAQIIARLDHQLQEQKEADKQKHFAMAVNAAEKGMADARMLLMLGQVREAIKAVDHLEGEIAQLPERWGDQFKVLKKEIYDKRDELDRAATMEMPNPTETKTMEMEAAFGATMVTQPGPSVPTTIPEAAAVQPGMSTDPGTLAPLPRTEQFEQTAPDLLYPKRETTRADAAQVAPELQEFLQPEPARFSPSKIGIGIAALVVVGVVAWWAMRPGATTQGQPKAASGGAVAGYTYAEINAEPWATVSAFSPANGDAANAVGQMTPLRVKLPPGKYTVTLQGPSHELKQLEVTVSAQGGTSAFATFKKPDLEKIVGKD